LRQNILEPARLPITAPIWCEQGIETIIQPPDEPLFPPEPTHSPEQAQQEETENTLLDKGPMESQAWTDNNIRRALEEAHLHEAIQQSKQPQFPPTAPTSKRPAAASAARADISPPKHTSGHKQRRPPDHKTDKQTKTPKATQQTPVKAIPPNRPTQINRTLKQPAKHTPAEPHTPAPKRRRTKTTHTENHNQQATNDSYADNVDLSAVEAIFEQFAEEESPIIPSPEFESPVDPVESTRKKRRKH